MVQSFKAHRDEFLNLHHNQMSISMLISSKAIHPGSQPQLSQACGVRQRCVGLFFPMWSVNEKTLACVEINSRTLPIQSQSSL
jgi:hypothetical protein